LHHSGGVHEDVDRPVRAARSRRDSERLRAIAEIRDDREVETTEYNFDKLAFDPWHPARSPRATFFFDEHRLLRTETSPSQIHALEEQRLAANPAMYWPEIPPTHLSGVRTTRELIDARAYQIYDEDKRRWPTDLAY